jgi:hypothetical protein
MDALIQSKTINHTIPSNLALALNTHPARLLALNTQSSPIHRLLACCLPPWLWLTDSTPRPSAARAQPRAGPPATASRCRRGREEGAQPACLERRRRRELELERRRALELEPHCDVKLECVCAVRCAPAPSPSPKGQNGPESGNGPC